jgi:hypothetical protein
VARSGPLRLAASSGGLLQAEATELGTGTQFARPVGTAWDATQHCPGLWVSVQMELSTEAERPAKRVRSSGAFRQGSMDETLAPAPAQFSLQQDPFILPRPWSPSSAGPSTSFSSTTTSTTTSTLDHPTPTGSSPGEQQQSPSLVPPLTNGGLQDMDADAAPAVPSGEYSLMPMSPEIFSPLSRSAQHVLIR